jgi:hypothetical protein
MNNSVWVHHGDYFEDVTVIEVISLLYGFRDYLEQIVDHAFNHEAGSGLDGVLASNNPYDLTVLDSLLTCGNRNEVYGIFSNCFTQFFDTEDVSILFIGK